MLEKANKVALDETHYKVHQMVRLDQVVEMDMAQSMKRYELKKELDEVKAQTSYFMQRVSQEISTAVRKQT